MLFFYFYLISFSLLGYGLLTCKALNLNLYSFGYLGFLGISSLTLISYFSSIFIAHNQIFNSLIIIFGVISFLFFFKKIPNIKKEFINYFFFFSILAIFIVLSKNHDDFSYYHFPYIYILTEYSHPIGLGQINNGFRNPSSIFFLSSLFYLPKINFYLFHIAPAFFLGFINLILFKNIFDEKIFKEKKFINLLSLIFLIFINIFFYRLAEHGTDRSGLILAIYLIILLFCIINSSSINKKLEDNIKFFLIILCLLISLKPFYFIYASFFIILFLNENTKKTVIKVFFTKTFFFCLFFIFFIFFYPFINSGCLIFPAKFTCFFNLKWSLTPGIIDDVKIWYELWAKGGATPSGVVEDKIFYISEFNWFKNWVTIYFFNKVSDFLLGLLVLLAIFIITFSINKKKPFLKQKNKIKYLSVYILISLCLIEWFLYHPALRYGGYHLFALVLYIPICIYLANLNIDIVFFKKRALVLIMITLIVFFARNISRLNKEYKLYQYNPFINTKFHFDEKFYLRYSKYIDRNINNFSKIYFLNKKFIIISKSHE